MPGGMRPFHTDSVPDVGMLRYAAGLRSVAGSFVGSADVPMASGDAVGVAEASGVADGFAFSREALIASRSTREV